MEFRVEMLNMFNELKETIECTVNKIQEDVRIKMRKMKTKMSQLKNLANIMKNSLEGLTSKVTAPEGKISELEYKVQ